MTALFLALTFVLQADSVETAEAGLDFGLLFHSTASADLKTGLSTLSSDSLSVFPRGSFSSDWITCSAEGALNYSVDSTFSDYEAVSTGIEVRWPGSPWIGTGASMGMISPFIPGINTPVREWQSYDVMDSTVVTVEAGGLLGFQGFWNQFGDSLSWYGVASPWLGFGTISWNGIRENSRELETLSGFLDLRRIQPWFLFVKENSEWTYLSEVRGWEPLSNHQYSVEIAPLVFFGEDSTSIGLTGYLHGKSRAVSGSVAVITDVDNVSDPTLAAGLDILSEVGIAWTLSSQLDKLENFHGELAAFYRKSPAGCGGALEMFDDSLRATATALYSPVTGVSTEFSVMSNINTDSPKPGCLLCVTGAGDDFTGSVTVEWGENSKTLRMEVSAWID